MCVIIKLLVTYKLISLFCKYYQQTVYDSMTIVLESQLPSQDIVALVYYEYQNFLNIL